MLAAAGAAFFAVATARVAAEICRQRLGRRNVTGAVLVGIIAVDGHPTLQEAGRSRFRVYWEKQDAAGAVLVGVDGRAAPQEQF